MKHKNTFFILIFTALAVIGAVGTYEIKHTTSTNKTACIYVNGEIYKKINLDDVKESYTIELDNGSGGHNTVLVEHDGISMQDADCPDKICVKTGKIKNSFSSAVCLPNRVTLRLEDTSDEDVDAVSGSVK